MWNIFGKDGEIYWKDIVGSEEFKRYEPNADDKTPGKELEARILADPFRWRQKVLAAKEDQKERMTKENSRDRMPKWKKNQTLKKWWEGKYGEQNYFSIQDAIKQQRCNGDEMQWYLFYSKPNYMDEFCTVSFSKLYQSAEPYILSIDTLLTIYLEYSLW